MASWICAFLALWATAADVQRTSRFPKMTRRQASPSRRHRDHVIYETCPVTICIRAIAGKWKTLVLRSMFLNGPQRYNDLLATVPGIQAKELTRNLRELQSQGLLAQIRTADRSMTVYELTEIGAQLFPVFKGLHSVGERLAVRKPG